MESAFLSESIQQKREIALQKKKKKVTTNYPANEKL